MKRVGTQSVVILLVVLGVGCSDNSARERTRRQSAEESDGGSGQLSSATVEGREGALETAPELAVPPEHAELVSSENDRRGKRGSNHGNPYAGFEWICRPRFDNKSAPFYSDGMANVMIDEKWGVIDAGGDWVLQADCDREPWSGIHQGAETVARNGRKGFYDFKQRMWITECRFDGTWGGFRNGYALVKVGDKWGAIDRTGNYALEPVYDGMMPFSGKVFPVARYERTTQGPYIVNRPRWGLLKPDGSSVLEFRYDGIGEFENGVAMFTMRGASVIGGDATRGFINERGEVLQAPSFSSWYGWENGYACIEHDEKYGSLDESLSLVTPMIYDSDMSFDREGVAVVEIDGRFGIMLAPGMKTFPDDIPHGGFDGIEADYSSGQDEAWFGHGPLRVERDGKYGFIDRKGNLLVPIALADATAFEHGFALAVNAAGHLIILRYEAGLVESVTTDVALEGGIPFFHRICEDGHLLLTREGKAGVLDQHGTTRIPFRYEPYSGIDSTAVAGVFAVSDGDAWGLMHVSGEWIVPAVFDKIGHGHEGIFSVKKDGKWGLITLKRGIRREEGNHGNQERSQADASPPKVLDLAKTMPEANVVVVSGEVISRQLLTAIGDNASNSSLRPAMALAAKGELGKAWLMLHGPDVRADKSPRLQSAATDYLAFLILHRHWTKDEWPQTISKERITILSRLMDLHDVERGIVRNPGRAMLRAPMNIHVHDLFPDLPSDAIIQASELAVEGKSPRPVETSAALSGGVSTSGKVDLDLFLGGRNWRTRCVFTSAGLEEATTAYEYVVRRTKEISPDYPVVVDLYDVADSAIRYYGTGSKYFVGITMRLPNYDNYCEALAWKELKELQSNPQDSVQGNGSELMRGLRARSEVPKSFRWRL